MKLRKMFLVLASIILLVVLGIFWLLIFSEPVIWSFKESGEVSSEPSFAVFNPFREKKVEAEAETFLNLLKNGDCEKAILNLKYKENYADMCERESLNKLEDWKLSNRKDNKEIVRLYYRVKRTPASAYIGQVWIELKKETDEWKIINIEAIY